MELDACLDIIKELHPKLNLEKAKDVFDKQGHSGMSRGLVGSMVKELCSNGTAFITYIKE